LYCSNAIFKDLEEKKIKHLNTSEVEEDNSPLNVLLKDKPQHIISANGSTKSVI
jgi:hypothetical protein